MSIRRTTLALCGALLLAATGCGSNELSGGSTPSSEAPTSTAPTTAGSSGPDLSAALPAKIKAAGIFNAVAAKFGVTVEYKPALFDTIITGVQGGKYDIGVSSFTINAKRKQQVNMVSYFKAGTQWATPKGNPKGVDPNNACGKTVAVQKGTTQLEDDLPVKQKACKDAGKPEINLVIREKQDQANADVATGKADAMLADSPIVLYAAKQSNGQIEPLGQIYDAAPYGYVIPKAETQFAAAIVEALKATAADGSYKAALAKWGNESGAISNFAVNP